MQTAKQVIYTLVDYSLGLGLTYLPNYGGIENRISKEWTKAIFHNAI